MQFPRLVYKSAEVHALANDEQEFEALITNGWFPTVPEATAGKLIAPSVDEVTHAEAFDQVNEGDEPDTVQPVPDLPIDTENNNAPLTRDELKQKASDIGLMFPRNVTDERLVAMIAEASAKE